MILSHVESGNTEVPLHIMESMKYTFQKFGIDKIENNAGSKASHDTQHLTLI